MKDLKGGLESDVDPATNLTLRTRTVKEIRKKPKSQYLDQLLGKLVFFPPNWKSALPHHSSYSFESHQVFIYYYVVEPSGNYSFFPAYSKDLLQAEASDLGFKNKPHSYKVFLVPLNFFQDP